MAGLAENFEFNLYIHIYIYIYIRITQVPNF